MHADTDIVVSVLRGEGGKGDPREDGEIAAIRELSARNWGVLRDDRIPMIR